MDKKGFTLIELLIVVVIIGILAAIAIPKFGETRERAYVSAMQSDLRQVQTAQEMYYQDNDFSYAANTGDLETAGLFTESSGVTITIGDVTDQGFEASAAHDATARTCALTAEGVIDCTE